MTAGPDLELVRDVAAALTADAAAGGSDSPHVWTVEIPYDHSAWLVETTGTGARLSLRIETYGAKSGRLMVAGMSPEGANYSAGDTHGAVYGEITVSPDRGAAVVAREIIRRCLPVYLPSLEETRGRIARRTDASGARARLAAELAESLGPRGHVSEWRDKVTANLPVSGPFYGDMTPDYHAESVNIEWHGVPVDLAHKLAAVIAQHVAAEVTR